MGASSYLEIVKCGWVVLILANETWETSDEGHETGYCEQTGMAEGENRENLSPQRHFSAAHVSNLGSFLLWKLLL